MVWAGVCYGQRTQVHFIDCILNAQRYRDEILRPIVVPFIHDHHLMLQHDNARPHAARICTQFLEAENIQFLHGQHTRRTCHTLSMFGMLWIGVYDSVFQFLQISSNFAQPLKRSGQPDQVDNLINSMRRRCVESSNRRLFGGTPTARPVFFSSILCSPILQMNRGQSCVQPGLSWSLLISHLCYGYYH